MSRNPGTEALGVQAYRRPEAPEYPIYVALKLFMHERLLRGAPKLPELNAHWLHTVLTKAGRDSSGMAELHGVSSHFLRERMRNLNHGTALRELEPGIKKTLGYVWNEPSNPGTLHSYAQLSTLLAQQCLLAVDVGRIAKRFGTATFDQSACCELFRGVRRQLLTRPWYTLRGAEQVDAPEFARFMGERRRRLLDLGLLVADGQGFRVSRKGELCTYWLDLFVNSVDYPVKGHTGARSPASSGSLRAQ